MAPPDATPARRRRIIVLALVASVFGALHHLDHVVRANHVGWPLTPTVTPFTFSLVVYPLLLGGAWITAKRAVSPWYEPPALERIAEAFKYVERGHKKGNVVITVAHP